ncbi:hypothetical protein [Alkalimarinus alittae]|uniref:Uncharacterized protein n=1 Tax=Alkalimarinus alittae TaxID=2961619 RepID=A0ABY6N6R3_9ALTE|nr:hypothetical protein [Alkalimarinus alittae]UZE97672.1 hypothetical protein NKI27_08040 [Alkalimarinus alittae]
MFALSWKTAEYPSWAISDNKSTEIVLETQCSDRKWTLTDQASTSNDCTAANEGIVACGDMASDLSLSGKPVPDNNYACVSITDAKSAQSIVDLESRLLISVRCLPAVTTQKIEGEDVNVDYIKASVVPYSVATRKVERYSLADKAPAMNNKVCDSDS